jgi:hypothetical protein
MSLASSASSKVSGAEKTSESSDDEGEFVDIDDEGEFVDIDDDQGQSGDDSDDENVFGARIPDLVEPSIVLVDTWYAALPQLNQLVNATLRTILTAQLAKHQGLHDSLAASAQSFDPQQHHSAQLIRSQHIENIQAVLRALKTE